MRTRRTALAEACTVLIAAGDPGLAASLRFSLEQEGYAAALCDELSLAGSLSADVKPSCVVLDQDVFAKLSLLGSQSVTESGVPVILLVGQPTPRLLDRARTAGVTRMVEKPLAGDMLLAEIKGALDGLRTAQMSGI
jgi:DNA-binding response OmpR family regulator